MDCSFFVTCKLASEKEILPNGMELILTLHIHPLPRPLPHVPYTPLDRILRTWPKTLQSLEHSFPLTSSEGLNKFHSLTYKYQNRTTRQQQPTIELVVVTLDRLAGYQKGRSKCITRKM